MSASVKVRGLAEAIQTLKALGRAASPEVVMPALQAGGDVIAQAWASRIRRKSGKTADQIKARRLRRAFGGSLGVVDAIVVNAGNRSHVARFLEDGYLRRNKRTGTVTHIPAYPSAAAAFESSEDEAGRVIEERILAAAGR